MKNFILYSKNPISSRISEANFSQIKFFKRGPRWFYILGALSPLFLFRRGQYKLGLMALIFFSSMVFLPNFFTNFAPQIYFFSLSLQVLLVIFGDDCEEFFLKKSGYKAVGVVAEKSASRAQEKLGSMLDITFSSERKSKFLIHIITYLKRKKTCKMS